MTSALLAFYLGMIGLVVGCFLGLVSVRWPRGEDIVHGRSHCRTCHRSLSWPDLIPVASYVRARGRCRSCAAPIPLKHPLIELAAGGVGVWAALAGSTVPEAILTALLGWQLLLIAVIDHEHYWLPDRLTLTLLVTGVIAAGVLDHLAIQNAIIGAAAGFATVSLFRLVYRRWRGRDSLGDGDAILFGAGGAWVGWSGLPIVLLIASLAGLSLALARRMRGERLEPRDQMPFAPFLATGVWLMWIMPL
jgi:leader peptidase (prepilin peptidase)/N-methyltransferase